MLQIVHTLLFWIALVALVVYVNRFVRTTRRIYDTLMSDEIPSPHDTVLLGLALAGGLLEAFLSKAEIARLEDRIREAEGPANMT